MVLAEGGRERKKARGEVGQVQTGRHAVQKGVQEAMTMFTKWVKLKWYKSPQMCTILIAPIENSLGLVLVLVSAVAAYPSQ